MATQAMPMMGALAGRGTRNRAESFQKRNRDLYELQRRGRRGPTPEMFFTKHIDNTRIVKADDPERRREMRSFTVAMCMLFLFVMVYVWQHFAAIEIGYQIETQKAQVEKLREDNRQLRLTEAQLNDPDRIDRIAKQLGMDMPQPGQVVRPDGTMQNSGPVMAQAVTAPVNVLQ